MQVPRWATEPPVQVVVNALLPVPPLAIAAQGWAEQVSASLDQLVAEQLRVMVPA